ncbi:amino acid ABC transporter permease [Piscinibacter terrae]|uniref:Amino acid ABC transporter permease n=1 Tax=Piscinibacter terrae TaxID=2496871 RepID=A0A3N7HTA8_9BURK|nr:amino acid ABC transporter permease [Albitalea terrae]RQP25547.1 amino acid ABC transporter permease [Albitalea terrae]
MNTLSLWPAFWTRQQRSTATIVIVVALMLALLWTMAGPLSIAPEPIGNNAQSFAEGTRITLQLTVAAGAAGLLLGIIAALGRVSAFAPARWLAGLYIWIMRGTPLLLQVLFAFFALPELLPVLKLDEFSAACLALAFNVGAYNAEAIRAGLLAVPRGQIEAARSLGMSRWFTFIDVTFPQAFKIALPPLVNNLVALLKDSSLAYVIGVVEVSLVSTRIQAATFQPVPCYVTTACIYLAFTTLMTQVSDAIERRFDVEGKLS